MARQKIALFVDLDTKEGKEVYNYYQTLPKRKKSDALIEMLYKSINGVVLEVEEKSDSSSNAISTNPEEKSQGKKSVTEVNNEAHKPKGKPDNIEEKENSINIEETHFSKKEKIEDKKEEVKENSEDKPLKRTSGEKPLEELSREELLKLLNEKGENQKTTEQEKEDNSDIAIAKNKNMILQGLGAFR